MLTGRKTIAIGDRDGISGEGIAACAVSAGAEVVLVVNGSYVCAMAGAMDLECQKEILNLARRYGSKALIVVLGLADVTGAQTYARTLTTGDPAHVGALTGVQLELAVVHIVDPAVKAVVDWAVYAQFVGWMEQVLDVDDLVEAVRYGGRSETNAFIPGGG